MDIKQPTKQIIITISRQNGSNGRGIGKLLSKRLGIKYYDTELIKRASEENAVSEEIFNLADEKMAGSPVKNLIDMMRTGADDDVSSPKNIFKFISETIRKIAETESCVIIGRCASALLADQHRGKVLRIFVYADIETRIRRIMERQKIDFNEAQARVLSVDRQREKYHKVYTGLAWDDKDLYDLMINTSTIDDEEVVEMIYRFLENRDFFK